MHLYKGGLAEYESLSPQADRPCISRTSSRIGINLFWFHLVTVIFFPLESLVLADSTSNRSTPASGAQEWVQLLLQGRREEAVQAAENAGRKDLKPLIWHQFAYASSLASFQEAVQLSDDELWGECIKKLDTMILADRSNLKVRLQKAECLLGHKEFLRASDEAKFVHQLSSGSLRSAVILSEALLLSGAPDAALRVVRSTRRSIREPVSVYLEERWVLVRARSLEKLNRLQEAVFMLRDFVDQRFDVLAAAFELARIHGDWKAGGDWQTRRYFSLVELRARQLRDHPPRIPNYKEADIKKWQHESKQKLLELDKRLGVEAQPRTGS